MSGSIRCEISGTVYRSVAAAAEEHSISFQEAKDRLDSDSWPDWKRALPPGEKEPGESHRCTFQSTWGRWQIFLAAAEYLQHDSHDLLNQFMLQVAVAAVHEMESKGVGYDTDEMRALLLEQFKSGKMDTTAESMLDGRAPLTLYNEVVGRPQNSWSKISAAV